MGEGDGTHSSTLAWKIPWTEEPGRLQSMGLQRVGHDWVTSLSLFTFMHWRRKWQPTPVFLPGESQGWGSLVGCRLWGCRVGHNWSNLAPAAAAARRALHCLSSCSGPASWTLLSAIAWCFTISVRECCPLKTTGHYGNSECFHHHCFSDQSNLTFHVFSISAEKATVHVFILSISEGWGDDPWGYVLPNRDVGDPGGILGYSVFVRRP